MIKLLKLNNWLNKHYTILAVFVALFTTGVYLSAEAYTRFATKVEVETVKTEVNKNLEYLKSDMKADIQEMKADIKELLQRTSKR